MVRTSAQAAALEAALRRGPGRYLRGLRVVPREDGVDVEGEAPNYYLKQLVIREVRASAAFPAARVRITVRRAAPAAHDPDGTEPAARS